MSRFYYNWNGNGFFQTYKFNREGYIARVQGFNNAFIVVSNSNIAGGYFLYCWEDYVFGLSQSVYSFCSSKRYCCVSSCDIIKIPCFGTRLEANFCNFNCSSSIDNFYISPLGSEDCVIFGYFYSVFEICFVCSINNASCFFISSSSEVEEEFNIVASSFQLVNSNGFITIYLDFELLISSFADCTGNSTTPTWKFGGIFSETNLKRLKDFAKRVAQPFVER